MYACTSESGEVKLEAVEPKYDSVKVPNCTAVMLI